MGAGNACGGNVMGVMSGEETSGGENVRKSCQGRQYSRSKTNNSKLSLRSKTIMNNNRTGNARGRGRPKKRQFHQKKRKGKTLGAG
ncbi:hypothetical protein DPMN_142307 [Dreissena polymorpha]|uniref:Uncharacterized protein n=1 Tax=Dreissena polymorpha TaxID=45954 RepID=A0A9D4GBJ9_DREPO|nr:hypothetical protein DPMN_142307 [Dreissena polymorpha]